MELECFTLTQLASLIRMDSMFTQPPAAASERQAGSQREAGRQVQGLSGQAGWLAGLALGWGHGQQRRQQQQKRWGR